MIVYSLKQKIKIKLGSPKPSGDGSDTGVEFKAIPSVESATISNASSPTLPEEEEGGSRTDEASRSQFDEEDEMTATGDETSLHEAMDVEDSGV